MRRFLSMAAWILSLAWPGMAEESTIRFTVVLTPERVKALKLETLAPVITVSHRGAVVVAGRDNLVMLNTRQLLLRTQTPVSDCAFTPDGALLMISGRRLGYISDGQFHSRMALPENAMRLAIGQKQIYVFGGDNDKATSIYVVEPERGHARLCVMPFPIGAASVARTTLYFSAGNDIYRLVPGGEINLVCHLPGPPVTSMAACDDETLYFIAGRTLYLRQAARVGILCSDIGDMACWQNGILYILNTEKQSLIKLENLAGLEDVALETP